MRKTVHQLEKRGVPFHDLIRAIVMIESFSYFWFEFDIKINQNLIQLFLFKETD